MKKTAPKTKGKKAKMPQVKGNKPGAMTELNFGVSKKGRRK